uniref:TPT domain-containing protein n=1 Tax=Rhabditophanes sp. KR3021 TaxID=114890 RepID=A0AC35TJ00_9BILA
MVEHPAYLRLSSGLFYAFSSILIVFANKILLTNLKFPSFVFVGLGQMVATVIILGGGHILGYTTLPKCDKLTVRRVMPLPLFYLVNLLSGLGGTQMINLPMFTVLRRFSILITMILEFFILGVTASKAVKWSVFLMIIGSIIAGVYDLSFDALGYSLITINNFATAACSVYTKQKLNSNELGQNGILFYNALFMIVPTMLITYGLGDFDLIHKYIGEGHATKLTLTLFLWCCICGFVLNYALLKCNHYNSALTTCCVGILKNLIVTYVGMISSGDYIFTLANLVGVNISVVGSLLYTYIAFSRKQKHQTRVFEIPSDKQKLLNV